MDKQDIKETCPLLQAYSKREKISMRFSKNRESARRNKMFEEQEVSTARNSNVKQGNENARIIESNEKDKIKSSNLKSSETCNVFKLFRRPSTIRLKVEEEHETIELIKEIVKVVSRNSIGRVAVLSEGVYHIGFKDSQVMNELLMEGFMFKGNLIQPTLFDNRFIIVNIEDLPFNIESKQVIHVLSQYGKIICHKMPKYQDNEISWLETGEMKVGMLMFEDIPKFLLIDNEPIYISYRKLIQVCNDCGKECFAMICREDEERNICENGGTDNEDNANEQVKIKYKNENMERSCDNNISRKKDNGDTADYGGGDHNDVGNVKSVEEYNKRKSIDEVNEMESEMENTDEDSESTDEDSESADEDSESADEDSDVELSDEYCEIDCVEVSKVETAEEDNVGEEFKETALSEDVKISEEVDDDDSGYCLENSNNQSDEEHKKETENNKDKCDKMDTKNNKKFTSANDKNSSLQTVKVGTFLDTISTPQYRSDFDCERVLVTVMDKIKDSLSLELGRNVNRNMLAKVMDNHNYWPKWYNTVRDRKMVNWNSYYFTISENYRKMMRIN